MVEWARLENGCSDTNRDPGFESQSLRQSEKNIGSNFILARSGLFFFLIEIILFGNIIIDVKISFTIILPKLY